MKSKKTFFIVLAIVAIVIILVIVGRQSAWNNFTNISSSGLSGSVSGMIALKAPKGDLYVSLATTSADQELGLSGRDSLPADQGMLFVFSSPGSYPFWMKDMNFPLDMVWINPDKTVAGVTPNIAASTYPDTFLPSKAVSYILELNAGATKKYGIATGTALEFEVRSQSLQ